MSIIALFLHIQEGYLNKPTRGLRFLQIYFLCVQTYDKFNLGKANDFYSLVCLAAQNKTGQALGECRPVSLNTENTQSSAKQYKINLYEW